MKHEELDPHGYRLPIKIDSTSNGEFVPLPISKVNEQGNRLALENATQIAKRKGQSRRRFLISSCGAASTLLAFNQANAESGKTGGWFDVSRDAAYDPDAAQASVGGQEFIFDVQGHYVNPNGAWLEHLPPDFHPYRNFPKVPDSARDKPGYQYLDYLSENEFIKDIFLDSDTDIMVLSFVPSTKEREPVTIEDADRTRQIVSELEGSKRLLLHGRVNPNQDGDLDAMEALVEQWDISAFKTYTQWGPEGKGFFLHDDAGLAMIEKARSLGVHNICVHKGLPFGAQSYEHSQCSDIGVVAKQFPDMNFLIYHSGFVTSHPERGYGESEKMDGVDTLVASLLQNEVAPNSNVYAELGSTWRFLMRDPDAAAHVLGKLLKYCGQDNVVWGTDSIWYGSPQDQIQVFRTFQISPEYQDKYGYPMLTPDLRKKVFGLNAAKPYKLDAAEIQKLSVADRVSSEKTNYLNNPQPSFATYGPKNRREFLNLLRHGG